MFFGGISNIILWWSKEARCKRVHTVWLHPCKVLEQAQLNQGDRNQNSSCLRVGRLTEMDPRELLDWRKCFESCLDWWFQSRLQLCRLPQTRIFRSCMFLLYKNNLDLIRRKETLYEYGTTFHETFSHPFPYTLRLIFPAISGSRKTGLLYGWGTRRWLESGRNSQECTVCARERDQSSGVRAPLLLMHCPGLRSVFPCSEALQRCPRADSLSASTVPHPFHPYCC